GTPPAVVARGCLLLIVSWYLMLAALNTRDAAVFGTGTTEYRRVAHASGLAFGLLSIIGILLEWDGLRAPLLIALPVGTVGILIGRWAWRRWLQRRRLTGRYASRALV